MSSQTNSTIFQKRSIIWHDSMGNIMVRKDDFDLVLQALKDLLAVECIDDYTRAHDKAKDVIAKFERVQP